MQVQVDAFLDNNHPLLSDHPMASERKVKILALLLLPMIGIGVGLVVLEVAFRIIEPRLVASPTYTHRPPFYFKPEGAPTMQDAVYPNKKGAGVFRIAVIGDSFTFAPYMQYTDTFPKVLERMLNQNKTDKKGEVLNLGVPRYSTHHETQVAKDAVMYSPDLVLLQITLNDAELKPYWPTGLPENQKDRFGEMEVSGWKKSLLDIMHSWKFVASRLHNSKTHKEYVRYFYEQFENPKGLRKFKESIKSILDTSNNAGAKVVAVIFPLFGVPLDDSYPFHKLTNSIIEILKENNILALDLFAAYKGIPLEQIQVIPNDDRHPNEMGHRLAAEYIYLWLEENNLIPDELKIKEKFRLRIGTVKQPVWEGLSR